MRGLASRECVLKILTEVETKGSLLKEVFQQHREGLNNQDRALVQEIIFGVTRWKLLLDFNLNLHLRKEIRPGKALNIFRLTAYQILFLNSVPAHGAINTGVELLKKNSGNSLAKVGNAVFRKLMDGGLSKAPGNTLKAKSINTSHPLWMIQAWQKELPPSTLDKILAKNNEVHGHWVRVNLQKTSIDQCVKDFPDAKRHDQFGPHFPYLYIRDHLGNILNSNQFKEGQLSIQNPSAWLATRLLDWKPDESLLDLCSAPGGKSALMSEAFPTHRSIICADTSFSRLQKIRDVHHRLERKKLLPITMDAKKSAIKSTFDKIFIDAPCSNLGVLSRRPEIKWRQTPKSIASLSLLQKEILNQAVLLSHPGTVIVYCTCSPLRKETLLVIESFLEHQPDWKLTPAQNHISENFTKEDCLRIFPGETEFDGYFAARLVREK